LPEIVRLRCAEGLGEKYPAIMLHREHKRKTDLGRFGLVSLAFLRRIARSSPMPAAKMEHQVEARQYPALEQQAR